MRSGDCGVRNRGEAGLDWGEEENEDDDDGDRPGEGVVKPVNPSGARQTLVIREAQPVR